MDKLFLQIINMSINASYVILVVIMVRLLLKKAPKIFSYALWSVALFRLICPFSFASVFSLFRFIPVSSKTVPLDIMYAQTPQIQSGITTIDRAVNTSLPAPVEGASVNPIQIWIGFGEAIWLLGIFALIIYSIFTTIRLYHRLKSAQHISDNIYEMRGISTPFVFGIIKPKIYLPVDLSQSERAYILKHEQTHIKRFDHIIKPVAFLVLCVHWFNPLVWVAFFLMSEDMELSCDERVIKEMGSEIKKDYSASLLSLSTGRRIIGGCPLAFGENNTKGRIMNILNYKKPTFWVVIVAIVAVVAIFVGLSSNPLKKSLTVEDYAMEIVDQEIAFYDKSQWMGQWKDLKIIDRKITKLEKISTFDELLSDPVEIWKLEYRLKPNIEIDIMPSGLSTDDGWITEAATDYGETMMVFTNENDNEKSNPKYLGYMRSIENDFSTLAGQEIAIRKFLEKEGLLPHETYSGNHIVVKFPLSTGETSQLLLSQPVVQGEHGIWCVERWMDGNGNIYYEIPKTDGRISDYFKELQNESDNGHQPWLIDPLQVALKWINKGLGQHVLPEELDPKYSATVEDFMETPESHLIGFISNFKIDKDTKTSFHFDQIEWLTVDDTERLKELNIDSNDMPGGFYIYNPKSYPMHHQVTDKTKYSIINLGEEVTHKSVNMEEFAEYLEEFTDFVPPFWIITKDGYVQSITEQYVP